MITVSGVGVSSHLVEVWTCDHSEWSGRVIAMSGGVDLRSWRFLYSNGTCVNTLPKGAGINPLTVQCHTDVACLECAFLCGMVEL